MDRRVPRFAGKRQPFSCGKKKRGKIQHDEEARKM
jgi:hypothetical protein